MKYIKERGGIFFGRNGMVEDMIEVDNVSKRPYGSYEPSTWQTAFFLFCLLLSGILFRKNLILGHWHTHPSGDPNPSNADINEGRRFTKMLKRFGIGYRLMIITERYSYYYEFGKKVILQTPQPISEKAERAVKGSKN